MVMLVLIQFVYYIQNVYTFTDIRLRDVLLAHTMGTIKEPWHIDLFEITED